MFLTGTFYMTLQAKPYVYLSVHTYRSVLECMCRTTTIMGIVFSVTSYFWGLLATKPTSKFEGCPGIKLYDNTASPCARRVRMTLLEKGIPFTKVEVNLLKGEQMTEEYKRICPNKKVPAISFLGVPGIEDCSLYESNVITEFLDADIFPGPKLYPRNQWERAQVKMWQDWELGLVDDFVPCMYSNTLPFILQLMHSSKQSFLSSLPAHISPTKRDYWSKVYDASLSSPEELKQHAIVCYQNLITLEKALEGREFLVGETFSSADLSVLPRVSMYTQVGLDIPDSHFPNIVSYLKRLGDRHSIQSSQPMMYRLLTGLMEAHPQWIVSLGNWRTGRRLQRFNGSACLHQALSCPPVWRHQHAWQQRAERLEAGCVLLVDCALYPECWQIKLLLKEKGVKFSTLQLESEEVVGRWAGSDGVLRIHHAGHDVMGIRAVLDYLDSSCAQDGPRLLPKNPLQRAKVQTWQAWECTLGYLELSHLLETRLVSKDLVDRYGCDLPALLALQTDPHYQSKFLSILQCFVCGVMKDKNSGHLVKELAEKHEAAVSRGRKMVQEDRQWEECVQDRLDHLDTELQQHQEPYLLGQTVTLADLTVFCRLCFLRGLGQVDAERQPHVVRWFHSLMETRPCFRSVCQEIDGLFDTLKDGCLTR